MIEVGKVVTKTEERYLGPGMHWESALSRYETVTKESATVRVGRQGVGLQLNGSPNQTMTPERAIELAQLLMKAAESQVDYAQKRTELEEEMAKLDETFKDRISGLGIEGVEEPGRSKKPLASVPDNVIIVEEG